MGVITLERYKTNIPSTRESVYIYNSRIYTLLFIARWRVKVLASHFLINVTRVMSENLIKRRRLFALLFFFSSLVIVVDWINCLLNVYLRFRNGYKDFEWIYIARAHANLSCVTWKSIERTFARLNCLCFFFLSCLRLRLYIALINCLIFIFIVEYFSMYLWFLLEP